MGSASFELDAQLRARVKTLANLLKSGAHAPEDALELVALSDKLIEHADDTSMLYDSVLEHSSALENELSAKNGEIERILRNMRRYLSDALYRRVSGGREQATAGTTSRRNLTVFFSDVVGFTELTDSVEPETMSQLLNSYLDAMAKICSRWGGTIDKFIGDAVMIYFGDEDDADSADSARRCVSMALEMQSSLSAVQADWARFGTHLTLKIRVGINSGYCTVGNFGSNERVDYTLIGGNVNIASRLEHQAPPGGICVSGSTYALVKELIEVRGMGKISVKGVAHPVETYQVLGRHPQLLVETNPLLRTGNASFDLKALHFDAAQTSPLEREAMRDALERALAALQPAPESGSFNI